MNAWFKRNTVPIAIVLVASVVVIAGFELLDELTSSEPLGPVEGEASLTVAGLIKVTLFMLVPGWITVAVRRRQRSNNDS
jgi:hypothetical protein